LPLALPWGAINWAAPWLAPYRRLGEALAQAWAQEAQLGQPGPEGQEGPDGQEGPEGQPGLPLGALARALNRVARLSPQQARPGGYPLRFVPQAHLPPGQPYEAFIHATGRVPTREGLHDFFNGLVWLHEGPLKARMNALQAGVLAQGVAAQGQRGPVRDALTVLDENGALWAGPTDIWQALCERRWAQALVHRRPQWQQVSLQVVGHAALEKLLQPRKAHCVHLWRVLPSGKLEGLGHKAQAVLPVLGVPGWWAPNEAAGFYDDPTVFRPRPYDASPCSTNAPMACS
jgi:hypothetical protein